MVYPRDGMVSVRRHQVTQNRPPPISDQCNHVDAWRLIVMFIMSSLHGLSAPQFGMRLQPSPLFFTQCHFQIFLAKLQDGRLVRKRNGIFLAFFTGAEPQSTGLHPAHDGCKDNSSPLTGVSPYSEAPPRNSQRKIKLIGQLFVI